jgi:hypothetical protein
MRIFVKVQKLNPLNVDGRTSIRNPCANTLGLESGDIAYFATSAVVHGVVVKRDGFLGPRF